MTPTEGFLLFIVGYTLFVYCVLVPLTWLVREALLKLGDLVLSRRRD